MFFTSSIRFGNVRLGAIFTPEELGRLSKREKSMYLFLEQVISSVREEYNKIYQKLGITDELYDLCDKHELFIDNFLTDKNKELFKGVREKISFILKEIEKSKFSNSLTAARKEKITDAVFFIKDTVKEFEEQNLIDEISQNCPAIKYFYEQQQENNIKRAALLETAHAHSTNNNRHKNNSVEVFLWFISLLWLGLCFVILKETDGVGTLGVILAGITPFAIYWIGKELRNRRKYEQSERYYKRYQEYMRQKSDDDDNQIARSTHNKVLGRITTAITRGIFGALTGKK